ncbi:MAG: hypothetical protein NTW19_08595 [Planctomycetota bacterium]|nr:hypothetical protein [Planctomycetota bacterium]
MPATYIENFDSDAGGWFGFHDNARGPRPLEQRPGAVNSRRPWCIDYNHAPPGAGYMNLLFVLMTKGPIGEHLRETAGPNRFIHAQTPTDFTHARLSFRLRGELLPRGANLVLLIQASIDGLVSGWLLTGQPLRVTPDWSDQTIIADPDPAQWTCLGARHDRTDMYGPRPLSSVLANVNVNLLLVLFPLDIAPMGPLEGDPHRLRPVKDYPVWQSHLPEGYVTLDQVRFDLR